MPTYYKGNYNLGELTMPVECIEHGEGKLDKIASDGKPLPEYLALKLYPKLVIAIANYNNRMRGEAELPTQVKLVLAWRWFTREQALELCQCARDGGCAILNEDRACLNANDPANCPYY